MYFKIEIIFSWKVWYVNENDERMIMQTLTNNGLNEKTLEFKWKQNGNNLKLYDFHWFEKLKVSKKSFQKFKKSQIYLSKTNIDDILITIIWTHCIHYFLLVSR